MKNFPKFCTSGSFSFGTLVRMNTRTADVGLVADTNLADLDDNSVAFPFGHLNWLWFLSAHFALSQSLFVLLQTGVSVPCLRTVFVPCCELFLSYFYYTLFIVIVKSKL